MYVAEVTDRLIAKIPELEHRVHGAVELNAIVDKEGWPASPVAAYVVPGGLRGGQPESIMGYFRQDIGRILTVVMMFRSKNKHTGRALVEIDPTLDALVTAIAGWTPGDEPLGVFELQSQTPVSVTGPVIVYQTDFILPDQLRIQSP